MKKKLFATIPLLTALALTGCGGGDSDDDSSTDNNTSNSRSFSFPSELAVTSPLETADDSGGTRSLTRSTHFSSNSHYLWATQRINALLEGTTPLRDSFTPDLFFATGTDAGCFGPTLGYQNHPDAPTPNSGELPPGDLGLWQDTDSTTGHACAAAQLNARMSGLSDRSLMGLMSLASMISVADDNSIALPTAATSIDLSSEMNALGITNVTFSTAGISVDASGEIWSYAISLVYNDGSGDQYIDLTLTHSTGSSTFNYEGMLTYKIDDDFPGGHCPASETYNGTLYYNRSAANDVFIDAREGTYCGSRIPGPTTTDAGIDASETYEFLDPSQTYTGSGSLGWANNFSILRADFNPLTMEGDYAYVWQAGPNDSHSRVFNIGLNYHSESELNDGEAYFGYGDQVGSTDGSIQGFICNWAGPGNSHTLQDYAQRQFISYNSTSELFEVPTGGSDILYAPTNSCTYDGSGTFWYDRDLNGTDDGSDVEEVYTSGGGTPELDMMAPSGSATNITEAITNRGFNLP